MRWLLVALILALLPAQAMAAEPSKQAQFVYNYDGPGADCRGQGTWVRYLYGNWRRGRYNSPGMLAQARLLSRNCAFFMNGEDPPLPQPTNATERKLVKAWADLRSLMIQYAYWIVGDITAGGYGWYADNTWRGYTPIETRLNYYSNVLIGGH